MRKLSNHNRSVGLISTFGLDLALDRASWSSPVFRGPFGTLYSCSKMLTVYSWLSSLTLLGNALCLLISMIPMPVVLKRILLVYKSMQK